MYVRLKGINSNCEAGLIEANQECGFSGSSMNETSICDARNSGGFSSDGARVFGEINDSSNTNGVVNVELKAKMDGFSRDDVELPGTSSAYVSNPGLVTSNSDGDLDVEMRGVDGAIFTEKKEVDQNQGMVMFLQNSCKESEISLVVDLNLCHEKEICDKGTDANLPLSGGLEGNANTYVQDSDCTISQHAKIKEVVTIGQTNDAVGIDVYPHALIPEKRAKENQIEKEGVFYLSDLVWGKVRSHPWWPGQIIEPSAASETAIRYFKKDSYLIAYFGDQTFAWNEASKIKPFRMYFSQMKKQSNVEAFCDAVHGVLDEVSRRIEFGLACQCLPEDVLTNVKFQVLINAGVQEKSTRVYGGDSFSTAASFFPEKFINYLKVLAESPWSDYDVLEFVIARAQLLAFNRWKGYYQLPALEELNGVLGNDADLHESHKEGNLDLPINGDLGSVEDYLAAYGKRKPPSSSSHLHKPNELWREKKKQLDLMSGISSNFQSGESKFNGKADRERESTSRSKKRKSVGSVSIGRRGKSGRRGSQQAVVEHDEKFVKASEPGASTLTLEKFHLGKTMLQECPTSEILSKLCVAAASPMECFCFLTSIAGVLCNFRKSISLDYSKFKEKTMSSGKLEAEKLSKSTEAFEFEGIEDSYWTDRIIQSNLDERVFFEPENTAEKVIIFSEQEGLTNTNLIVDDKQEVDAVISKLDVKNSFLAISKNSEEYSPTTLILNFTDLESVPSIDNLNQIFDRFGPLEESRTEVLSKSKRAKLVFKRRSDAECAFSSAGKFSIFGPSLVSYRLKYEPSPSKSSSTKQLKAA